MTDGSPERRWACVPVVALVLLRLAAGPASGELKIPLSVRSFSERAVPALPVWTGVPGGRPVFFDKRLMNLGMIITSRISP